MADQPDRRKQEAATAAVLFLLFGEWITKRWEPRDFAQAAGDGLDPIFTDVYANAHDRMIEELGIDWTGKAPSARSAKSHARRVGREMASAVGADLRGKNLSPEELGKILSKARADRAAITEITTAISRAEADTADVVEKTFGQRPNAIWRAEWDACEICKKVNGKPRRVWSRRFPNGPPAHPHCRCWLEWALRRISG